MSKTTLWTLFTALWFSAHTQAVELAPSDKRIKSYIVEGLSIKKQAAYEKAVEWAAKTFHDSNSAIKDKSPDKQQLIAKGNVACNALKLGNGFASDQRLEFTLTVQLKDNRARLLFEDLIGIADGAYDSGDRPSTQEETETAAAKCLDPVTASLKEALTTKAKSNDNW